MKRARYAKPTTYPVVVENLNRVFCTAMAVTFALASLAAAISLALSSLSPGAFWFVTCGAVLAAAAALALWNCIATTVVVRPEDIEKTNLFGRRSVARDAVIGFRRSELAGGIRLVLSGGHALRIPARARYLAKDWFAEIRDLDADDLVALKTTMANDPRLGPSPALRQRKLARLNRAAGKAAWPVYGVMAWVILYPRPYFLAIGLMVLLPPSALAFNMACRGLLALNAVKNDPRPNVDSLLFLPPLVLGLRALLDLNILDWELLTAGSAVLAAAVTVLLRRQFSEVRREMMSIAIAFFLAWTYCQGAISQADVQFDAGPPQVFHTQVTRLSISRGRNYTGYEVSVTPWGPDRIDRTMRVSSRYFAHLKIGGRVCIYLRQGSLGIRWYELGDC